MRIAFSTLLAAILLQCPTSGALAGETQAGPTFDPGTEADREALFEFIVMSTMEWDAFASLQNHPFHGAHPTGIDVVAEMEKYRDELVAADTGEKMWYALNKISNVRRDPHLRVVRIDGGLELPEEARARRQVPVRFAVDYGDLGDRFFFISDLCQRIDDRGEGPAPSVGERLMAVNGRTVTEYVDAMRPYQRYSTENNLWWRLADAITSTRDYVPRDAFYSPALESLSLELERKDGSRYEVVLPYLPSGEIEWKGHGARAYPGFSTVDGMDAFETYTLYRPDDRELPVILLDWHGFRDDLPAAVDRLVEYAEEEGILDHHVIVDATRSGGGSNGAYALARLQSAPFRTTFGNLKVSEAMKRWVDDRLGRWRERLPSPSGGQDAALVHEWLKDDVMKAIEHGRLYTNDVPFKGVLPKWSDGIVEPAVSHFRGTLTVWLSPHGGSHLDQFAAQVVDNDIGHAMGMATGGFSNTWWTRETLRFPTTGKPIVDYEWSLGHSMRPNGQILQYNPAEPHEYVPQTRDNHLDYHAGLLQRTLDRLDLDSPAEAGL